MISNTGSSQEMQVRFGQNSFFKERFPNFRNLLLQEMLANNPKQPGKCFWRCKVMISRKTKGFKISTHFDEFWLKMIKKQSLSCLGC